MSNSDNRYTAINLYADYKVPKAKGNSDRMSPTAGSIYTMSTYHKYAHSLGRLLACVPLQMMHLGRVIAEGSPKWMEAEKASNYVHT